MIIVWWLLLFVCCDLFSGPGGIRDAGVVRAEQQRAGDEDGGGPAESPEGRGNV